MSVFCLFDNKRVDIISMNGGMVEASVDSIRPLKITIRANLLDFIMFVRSEIEAKIVELRVLSHPTWTENPENQYKGPKTRKLLKFILSLSLSYFSVMSLYHVSLSVPLSCLCPVPLSYLSVISPCLSLCPGSVLFLSYLIWEAWSSTIKPCILFTYFFKISNMKMILFSF